MNILIAGGHGYLGSHLVNAFSKYNVTVLTRDCNITDTVSLINPDIIINTVCSYGRNNETISSIYDSNFRVGVELLSAASQLDKKIVFINCGTSLDKNTNLYSISKAHLVEIGKFVSNNKLKFINMNLQHFYGPDAKNNFISYVINGCLSNSTIPLTTGIQKRDFIYITDVVNAFAAVVKNTDILLSFENIDVGSGSTVSIKELVQQIKVMTNSTSFLDFGIKETRQNEVLEMLANNKRLVSLGWSPTVDLLQGLKLTIEYYNEK